MGSKCFLRVPTDPETLLRAYDVIEKNRHHFEGFRRNLKDSKGFFLGFRWELQAPGGCRRILRGPTYKNQKGSADFSRTPIDASRFLRILNGSYGLSTILTRPQRIVK